MDGAEIQKPEFGILKLANDQIQTIHLPIEPSKQFNNSTIQQINNIPASGFSFLVS